MHDKEIECYCGIKFRWSKRDLYDREPCCCPECAAIEIRNRHAEAVRKALARLTERTPARFRATDTSHSDFNLKLWRRIETWRPTSERPWLGLVGPTGESKTRCGFLLLREIITEMIRPADDPDKMLWVPSFEVVSAYRFGEAVMGQFNDDSKAEAVEFLRRIRKTDVLLIDDLGKQRNSPAVAAELFALIDYRHAENLRTVWTANSSPEGIVTGMPEDLAAPLAGRIRECSTIITIQ